MKTCQKSTLVQNDGEKDRQEGKPIQIITWANN